MRTCVLMRCVSPYPITNAPNWGGRTPGSKLPASPPPWPSRPSSWTEGEKCPKHEAKSPFQSVSNLSMNGSEPRPGTAGNLSQHEDSDVHNRAGTAPGHLHTILHCLDHPAHVVHNNGHDKNLTKNCTPSRRKRVKFFQKPHRLKPTCIHCRTKLSAEYGDNPEVISQRPLEEREILPKSLID